MSELLLIIFRVMIFLSVALLVIGILKPEWVRFRGKTARPYNYHCRSDRPIDAWFYRRGRDSICWKG